MRPGRKLLFAAAACLAAFGGLFAGTAHAHDARPVSISIDELASGRYAVNVRAPESVSTDNFPEIHAPGGCERIAAASSEAVQDGAMRFLLLCPNGLDAARFEIRYPVYNPSLSTLFRLTDTREVTRTALLPPDQTIWEVPAKPSTVDVLRDYMVLGVGHIFLGFDHLLFVAGLLIIARTPRRVLLAVTGFTLAHSLTLALSVLNLVRLPSAPVEAAIALSILFLAGEIARPHKQGLASQYPALVAALFGLLHGFGFAGALREVGLPQDEIGTALLGFNLGVEIGQLGFIGAVTTIFLAGRKLPGLFPKLTRAGVSSSRVASYVIGTAAAFWLISRISSF